MTIDHEHFMELAIEEALKARKEGNTPIGSLIVKEGVVVALGRNMSKSMTDPTAHAEIVALRNGGLKLGGIELHGCTLYTTLAPCPMCCGALMVAHISRLVIGAAKKPGGHAYGEYSVERMLQLGGWTNKLVVVRGVLESQCSQLFGEWG